MKGGGTYWRGVTTHNQHELLHFIDIATSRWYLNLHVHVDLSIRIVGRILPSLPWKNGRVAAPRHELPLVDTLVTAPGHLSLIVTKNRHRRNSTTFIRHLKIQTDSTSSITQLTFARIQCSPRKQRLERCVFFLLPAVSVSFTDLSRQPHATKEGTTCVCESNYSFLRICLLFQSVIERTQKITNILVSRGYFVNELRRSTTNIFP